ncbi:hypothetical protein [Solirubrobacter deserti]|uniref:Uncharacterized protein n=1 Tax=Solirubrobacter deserti TaxID=2282478 RepID=A0ABT4RFW7_9ACTN|nr:hypothetical protein [Solirubrobacter deserti]MDA0137441.1 hypothetical protein [Solirubrobacter deserti]
MLRCAVLACLLTFVLVPSAHAAIGDELIPYVDASDDVHVGTPSRHAVTVRFGPRAAKLYRSLRGGPYSSGCIAERRRGTSSGGHNELPRKRSRVTIAVTPGADVCFVATAARASDGGCINPRTVRDRECVRFVVALSDRGRAIVDEIKRTFEIGGLFFEDEVPFAELQQILGGDLVTLATPDALPPPGTVGVFDDGNVRVVAALLADGTRWFARRDGGVYSTNVPRLFGDRDTLTLF